MSQDITSQIKQFIADQFLVEFDERVHEQTNLFRGGHIDSFGFLELVTFLEKTYQIKITDDELVSDALISVNNITQCINKKLEAA